jgi:hypothetical protein
VASQLRYRAQVVEFALFRQRMDAHIEPSRAHQIVIEGVPRLRDASTRPTRDRLEAFSYLVIWLITRGEVRVHGYAGPAGHRDHHAGQDERPFRHHRRADDRLGTTWPAVCYRTRC